MPSTTGILNVDKPQGWTSRRVVDLVQTLARPRKVGHAGTLDPLATGVLAVCVGQATRLVPYLQELRKSYRGEFLLGRTSTTEDIEGEITETPQAPTPEQAEIEEALRDFIGPIQQVPPAFSAVKVQGRRAYALARQGRPPTLEARTVQIDAIALVDYSPPRLTLDITCGSGTYIRSIGRDLGQRLGCGAVMSGLVRTHIGGMQVADAISPDDITPENWATLLIPPLEALAPLPRVTLSPEPYRRILLGQRVPPPDQLQLAPDEPAALVSPDGALAAIVKSCARTGHLAPQVVLTDRD